MNCKIFFVSPFIKHGFLLFHKGFPVMKMENSEDRLQHVVGDKDKFYKDVVVVTKGKETIQKKKNPGKTISAY